VSTIHAGDERVLARSCTAWQDWTPDWNDVTLGSVTIDGWYDERLMMTTCVEVYRASVPRLTPAQRTTTNNQISRGRFNIY